MAKSSIEKYKSFEKWKYEEVQNEFKVTRMFNSPAFLTDFLSNLPVLNEVEKSAIDELQKQLSVMTDAWNEYDMSILFIGPLFNIIKSQQIEYRTFFNHTLKTILNGKEIGGRIDGMLAKGRQIPTNPIFFIQEYKAESGPNGDPLGQLLIEMVAAQAMNKEPDQALYGCYIIGRNWFFVVLEGKQYAVSDAYVATQADIYDIVGILKKIKMLFEKKIGYK
jgi:hypothetical protein